MRVIDNSNDIMNTNGFTWNVNDNVEISIPPYPDVTGYQYHIETWSAGGSYWAFMDIDNVGARQFQTGILIRSNSGPMPDTGGAAHRAWKLGMNIDSTETGICISCSGSGATPTTAAISMDCGARCTGGSTDNAGMIIWGGGAYLRPNNATNGMAFRMAIDAPTSNGVLVGSDPTTIGTGTLYGLNFSGFMQMTPRVFALLPTCAPGLEGSFVPVTDANSSTWGATIGGGSASHILAYCDGTNWTVAAK
jgi:hypothetical protein